MIEPSPVSYLVTLLNVNIYIPKLGAGKKLDTGDLAINCIIVAQTQPNNSKANRG